MSPELLATVLSIVLVSAGAIVAAIVVHKARVIVPPGHALIITGGAAARVSFDRALVVPLLHRAEIVDLRIQTVKIELVGKHGVSCRDGVRVDLTARFVVRVNRTAEDVLAVAHVAGTARAAEPTFVDQHFAAKFTEALRAVASEMSFDGLAHDRLRIKDAVMSTIGTDLGGWILDDAILERFEPTPVAVLDPDNILDAEGIRATAERTSQARIRAAEIANDTEMRIATLESQCRELAIEQERRQAEALELLRKQTGRDITADEIDERLARRLREMVDVAVSERLGNVS